MLGKPPSALTCLNEVELTLISLARTEKHMFSFSAGYHKEIKSWYTMYLNDVEYMNRVMNYFETQQSQSELTTDSQDMDLDETYDMLINLDENKSIHDDSITSYS